MSGLQSLKLFVNQRLTAAVEDIFGHLEKTIREYEEEMDRRHSTLLDVFFKSENKLGRDVQQLVSKEEVPPEQQEGSPSLDQDQDPEPPHIKEEQEELWTSQEGELLRGLEEADITRFPFSPVPVKSEEDDEEKPQSSQLHQSHTEQVETGADGGDCGGPEPARNPDPDRPLDSDTDDQTEDSSEPETDDKTLNSSETDDSDYYYKETRKPESGLNSLKNEVSKSDMRCNTGGKSLSCSECGKRFDYPGHLKRHMRTHTGEKPFSCSVCGKKFIQKVHLTLHMARHTGENRFCCSVCGKGFPRKESLVRHMIFHSGEKHFSCSFCKKQFTRSDHMVTHMRIHTGEKRYSCSVCDRRFTWLNQLKRHKCAGRQSSQLHQSQTEEHMNVKKPFSCSDCGKRFHRNKNLVRHMRFHSGEKPFSCSFCKKLFTRSDHMVTHMRIHTGGKPYRCSFCEERFTLCKELKRHQCVGRQSSQLHQNQTEQVETGADGEDCGGPEPARNPDPDRLLDSDTDDQTED